MRFAQQGLLVGLVAVWVGCGSGHDFDGLYRVTSYTLNETSCDSPGEEVAPDYPLFRIEEESFLGLTFYPVYPCDEAGNCEEDNDGTWGLLTTESRQDDVSSTSAWGDGTSCHLGADEKVIKKVDDTVVLESRDYELVLEPYDADACTTDNAESMRDAMQCIQLRRLVGAPE